MSFSSTAVLARSKETKALNLVLAYSLIGSLSLHIAILASGIGNFLPKVSSSQEKPIEVLIIDSPIPSDPKPPLEKKEVARPTSETNVNAQVPSSSRVIAQKEHTATVTAPADKFSESVQQRLSGITEITEKPQSARQTKPVVTSHAHKYSDSKPVKIPPKEVAAKLELTPVKPTHSPRSEPTSQSNLGANSSSPQSQDAGGQGSEKLTQELRGLRDSKASRLSAGNSGDSGKLISTGDRSTVAVGSGIRVSTGNGIGTGSGTRVGTGNGIGTGSGTGIRVDTGNGTGNGIGTGSGTRVGTGSGAGSGTGSRSGSATGNRPGNGETLSTAPARARIEPSSGNGNGRGDSLGNSHGSVTCRNNCELIDSELAKQRRHEGRPELAVDIDPKGNVTNSRLTRSSGDRDLDERALRQVRDVKLTPTAGGRQGIPVVLDYALDSSRHHRDREERKRQRQAEQRNQNTTANNSSSTESDPTRKRHLTSGTITDVPPEPTNRRLRQSASSSDQAATRSAESTVGRRLPHQSVVNDTARDSSSATSSSQQNARESPHQSRRQNAPTDTPKESEAPTRRRRNEASSDSVRSSREFVHRQPSEERTSSSQSRLRDSLRVYKQQSHSPDALPPGTNGN